MKASPPVMGRTITTTSETRKQRMPPALRAKCGHQRRSGNRLCSRLTAGHNWPTGRTCLRRPPRDKARIFVAQPEARIDIGKSGADEAGGIGLAVKVELDLRLQNQTLRDEQVIRGLELGGEMALAARIAGDLKIEEIRSEALNTKGRPIAGGS